MGPPSVGFFVVFSKHFTQAVSFEPPGKKRLVARLSLSHLLSSSILYTYRGGGVPGSLLSTGARYRPEHPSSWFFQQRRGRNASEDTKFNLALSKPLEIFLVETIISIIHPKTSIVPPVSNVVIDLSDPAQCGCHSNDAWLRRVPLTRPRA